MRRLPLAVLAALLFAAAAYADDVVVPLTVRPGTLSLAPASTLSAASRLTVTVTDARGHGAGWTLLARSVGLFTRPVLVAGVDARCGDHSTCTLPRTGVRYPVILSPFRPVRVFDAQRGTGMGAVILTLRLVLPLRAAGVQALRFSIQPS